MDRETAIVMSQSKSAGLGAVLAIFFGGLGLFYASVVGGIVMCLVELLALIISIVTLGFGSVLFPVVHVICVIWAIVAINSHNSKVLMMAGGSR